jgi:hypothetical protein
MAIDMTYSVEINSTSGGLLSGAEFNKIGNVEISVG